LVKFSTKVNPNPEQLFMLSKPNHYKAFGHLDNYGGDLQIVVVVEMLFIKLNVNLV
jgi:hypothetical protein